MVESEQRIRQPLVRDGGELRPASWEEALEAAAAGLRQAGERAAAIVGGGSSNEEGYLAQRIARRALGSPHVESRPRGGPAIESRDTGGSSAGGPVRLRLQELSRPELAASVSDLDSAESILVLGTDPLHAMPILDLRIRKAVRLHGARLAVATDRPSALDGGAEETARYAPGLAGGFLSALAGAVGVEGHERAPGELGADAERIAGVLRPGSAVIVWSGDGEAALLECARELGAKLLEVPAGANERGLREVGCLPIAGPGLSEVPEGRDASAIREGLAEGSLEAAFLVNADPVRDFAMGPDWNEALSKAGFVVAVSMFEDASTRHADVVFPAESYAEKEGTVTHPDGRIQRLRPGVPHPGDVRPTWQVLVELSARLGHETGLDSAPEVLAAIASEVPFYAGITPEEIGGTGVRWQERNDSADIVAGSRRRPMIRASSDTSGVGGLGREPDGRSTRTTRDSVPSPDDSSSGSTIRIGSYRDLWAAEVTERSPALRFLAPRQTLELAPADADRLGLATGDEVDVRQNGTGLHARVAIRDRVRPGSGFLIEGTAEANANALEPGQTVEVTRAGGES
jgi:NADH-quinone oxidoreductase subunit G